jgi:hypothetical protein
MCGSGIAPTVAGGSFIDLDPVNVDDQVPGHATPRSDRGRLRRRSQPRAVDAYFA